MATKKAIKETKYCSLIAQSIVSDEEYSYAIERIVVKDKGSEEIRFAVYKEQRDCERLLIRPLDIEEDILLKLIDKAIQEKIFTKKFTTSMRQILGE